VRKRQPYQSSSQYICTLKELNESLPSEKVEQKLAIEMSKIDLEESHTYVKNGVLAKLFIYLFSG